MVSKLHQFRFGCIKIHKAFPDRVNPRLEVVLETKSQVNFVSNARFNIESGANCNAVCVDAYLRTDDIRKINDVDQKQYVA